MEERMGNATTAVTRTVFGVPLAPDERVIYFRRIPRNPLAIGIVGVFLLPVVLLGVFVILNATRLRRRADWAQVVTNKRVFAVNGLGKILRQIDWANVTGPYSLSGTRSGLMEAGVTGANNARVTFTDRPREILQFLESIQNRALLETMTEVAFEAPAPPVRPGGAENKVGTALAVLGALGFVLAFVAFNRSMRVPVAVLGLLIGGAGAALITIAKAKMKQATS
jgi:hypothetical protein